MLALTWNQCFFYLVHDVKESTVSNYEQEPFQMMYTHNEKDQIDEKLGD